MGETLEHLKWSLDTLRARFRRLVWVPGNHELYTVPADSERGQARYEAFVAACRERDVLTPEDPYPTWEGEGGPCVIAPLFLLYDYSFRPPEVPQDQAVAWALESGLLCADEKWIRPAPHPSVAAWCAERCERTRARLESLPPELPTVLVNHFPLREELVRLPFIPRFSIWCGTKETADWHRRYRARVVVSGHLHIPATDWIDGTRFEEVSLGYPRQWINRPAQRALLREILPGPARLQASPGPDPF